MAIEMQAFGQAGTSSSRDESGLRGLRLTRRGRVVVWLLALVAAAGILLGGGRALAGEPVSPAPLGTVTVQSGQTLWQIASDVALPGEDVRDVVAEIKEVNGLATADIQAGQQLYVRAS